MQDLFCAFQGGAAGGEGSAVTFIKIHQFYSHTIEGLLAKLAGACCRIPAWGPAARRKGNERGEEGSGGALLTVRPRRRRQAGRRAVGTA